MRSRINRRSFLKGTVTAAAVTALPAWFIEECHGQAQPAKPTSANDRPHFAPIGCGGRGQGIAKEATNFGTAVAVCDVDSKHAEQAAQQLGAAKIYKDFRKLLERNDIPIILNGTPDHWHTLVNLAALKAGKDVYSEKPLTLTIDEGKRVVAASRATGRILQTGSQQRSDPRFRLACELVRNGRLGKLTQITTILPAGQHRGPFKIGTRAAGAGLGILARTGSPSGIYAGALPSLVPLLARLFRRHDDRLGRPSQRHRAVGDGIGPQRAANDRGQGS